MFDDLGLIVLAAVTLLAALVNGGLDYTQRCRWTSFGRVSCAADAR